MDVFAVDQQLISLHVALARSISYAKAEKLIIPAEDQGGDVSIENLLLLLIIGRHAALSLLLFGLDVNWCETTGVWATLGCSDCELPLPFVLILFNRVEQNVQVMEIVRLEVPPFHCHRKQLGLVIDCNCSYSLCVIGQLQKAHLVIVKGFECKMTANGINQLQL